MSISLAYNPQNKILYVTVVGPFSFDEYVSSIQKILHTTEYPPNVSALWDLRKADLETADQDFLNKIIQTRKQHPERVNANTAIIAATDLEYGVSRMFETLAEIDTFSQKLKVFRDYAEGEKWLLA